MKTFDFIVVIIILSVHSCTSCNPSQRKCFQCSSASEGIAGDQCKKKLSGEVEEKENDLGVIVVGTVDKSCYRCFKSWNSGGDVERGCMSKKQFEDIFSPNDKKSDDVCTRSSGTEYCACRKKLCNASTLLESNIVMIGYILLLIKSF